MIMKNVKLVLSLVIIGLLSWTCKESELRPLLDTVPSDAKLVAAIDFDRIFKECGCNVEAGKVTLTDELSSLVAKSDADGVLLPFVKSLLQSGSVELTQVLAFVDSQNDRYLTFRVNDESALWMVLDSCSAIGGRHMEYEGYCYTRLSQGFIVTGDGQGWITSRESHDIVADLKLMLQQTLKTSIDKVSWEKDYLSSGKMITLLGDVNELADGYYGCDESDGAVALLTLDSERNQAVIDVTLLSESGERLKFNKMFAKIDTSFKRYLYPYDNIAVAVGIPDNIDWNQLYESISARLSYEWNVAATMIMPYLREISGTLVVAAGPVAGAQSLSEVNASTWELMVILPLKENKANDFYQDVKSWARTLKLPVDEVGGTLEYKDGEVSYYVKSVGNNLIISNREIVERGDARLSTDMFEGKSFAAVGEVPYNSEIMKALGLPFGFDVTVWCDDNRFQVRTSLNRAQSSFMESVVAELARRNG